MAKSMTMARQLVWAAVKSGVWLPQDVEEEDNAAEMIK